MPDRKLPIDPFIAEAQSSSPAERHLHPSTLQQILEAIAVATTGFGQGLRGNPLTGLQLAQTLQAQRQARAENELLNQILGQGLQLGQTPENLPGIAGFESPGAAGISAPDIQPGIGGANPAYQDLIDRILQGSQQFARLGGDPNVLAGVLGKIGLPTDPIEKAKLGLEKGRLDLGKKKEERLGRQFDEGMELKRDVLNFQKDKQKFYQKNYPALRGGGRQEFTKESATKFLADVQQDYGEYLRRIQQRNKYAVDSETGQLKYPQLHEEPIDIYTFSGVPISRWNEIFNIANSTATSEPASPPPSNGKTKTVKERLQGVK